MLGAILQELEIFRAEVLKSLDGLEQRLHDGFINIDVSFMKLHKKLDWLEEAIETKIEARKKKRVELSG